MNMAQIATGLSSKITLCDGKVMPLFGLGGYSITEGEEDTTEIIALEAIKRGYRLFDTAQFYK